MSTFRNLLFGIAGAGLGIGIFYALIQQGIIPNPFLPPTPVAAARRVAPVSMDRHGVGPAVF